MTKKLLLLVLFVNINLFSQTNPDILNIINNVHLDSLSTYVEILSGGKSVILPGKTDTIKSRNRSQPGNELAADYLKSKLQSYGLDVYDDQYDSDGRNIYGIKYGSKRGEKYIICAHYDSYPTGIFAPGADDDASGCAAVLEAARLLKDYYTTYTVIFAFWDEEEYGLIGSGYFADDAFNNGDTILGVINLEMFGWDSNGDKIMEIHTNTNSLYLADSIYNVNTNYSIGLDARIKNPGTGQSDHASFWSKGYGAIVMSQAFFSGDGSGVYHTVNDKIEYFDTSYFHSMSKLAVGTISVLSGVSTTLNADADAPPSDFNLQQNYPNPFNPETKISFYLPQASKVSLKVYNLLGVEVKKLIDEPMNAGKHNVIFNAEGLASGIYLYTLRTNEITLSKKMIYLK